MPLDVVVALPPIQRLLEIERLVVDAPPLSDERPVTVKPPLEVREPPVIPPIEVIVPWVAMLPLADVVALPLTKMPPEDESRVVEALPKIWRAVQMLEVLRLGRPRDDVEVSVYVPLEFPTKIWPRVGTVEMPVPP